MGSCNQREAKASLNPQIEKQLTTGRMGRRLAAQHSQSPTSEVPAWLHYSMLGGKSCFLAHTGTQSSTLRPAIQPANLHPEMPGKPYTSRTQGSCCSHKPAGLVPCACSAVVLGFWNPTVSKQNPGCLLSAGTRRFNPLALLPHRNPQLTTQCQEPATTHASEPQAPCFAILLGIYNKPRADIIVNGEQLKQFLLKSTCFLHTLWNSDPEQ
jgi:hypothetical protein